MRKLTVKRRKTFVGCSSKVKIYIEDFNGDTYINGIKCRLLGKLKNNECATYEIGNESYKLFAIYDNISKNYCNDYYTISAGASDVEVSGIAHLNPGGGNPFLFDGVTDEEALYNRSINSKRGIFILIGILVSAFLAGVAVPILISLM